AIASLGGKAAHQAGRAHTWTSEEARLPGRKVDCRAGRDGETGLPHRITQTTSRPSCRRPLAIRDVPVLHIRRRVEPFDDKALGFEHVLLRLVLGDRIVIRERPDEASEVAIGHFIAERDEENRWLADRE